MVRRHGRTRLRTSEECQRILRHGLATNLEVLVIGGGVSGAPDGADERSRSHAITWPDEVGAVVRIDRAQPIRVGDLVSVTANPVQWSGNRGRTSLRDRPGGPGWQNLPTRREELSGP